MKVDILAFGAHPDDVELAASGTILKEIKNGKKVAVVDLTQGELGSRGTAETRKEESKVSNKILGISSRENLNMPDGFFEISQENLLKVVRMVRKYQPEIVLCNSFTDRHPDHGRASELVSQACFLSGLIKIETELDNEKQKAHRPKIVLHYIQDYYLKPDFVVDVSEEMETKFEAIRAYKTQFFNPDDKNDSGPKTPISGKDFFDFLKARGQEFGRPINSSYAEAFKIERLVGIKSVFDLV